MFSLQIIFAKVFQPFAFMIGVDWAETDQVASLIGLKLTINEILAYLDLGRMRRMGILSVIISHDLTIICIAI